MKASRPPVCTLAQDCPAQSTPGDNDDDDVVDDDDKDDNDDNDKDDNDDNDKDDNDDDDNDVTCSAVL